MFQLFVIAFVEYYGLRYTNYKDSFNDKILKGTIAKNVSIYFAML